MWLMARDGRIPAGGCRFTSWITATALIRRTELVPLATPPCLYPHTHTHPLTPPLTRPSHHAELPRPMHRLAPASASRPPPSPAPSHQLLLLPTLPHTGMPASSSFQLARPVATIRALLQCLVVLISLATLVRASPLLPCAIFVSFPLPNLPPLPRRLLPSLPSPAHVCRFWQHQEIFDNQTDIMSPTRASLPPCLPPSGPRCLPSRRLHHGLRQSEQFSSTARESLYCHFVDGQDHELGRCYQCVPCGRWHAGEEGRRGGGRKGARGKW